MVVVMGLLIVIFQIGGNACPDIATWSTWSDWLLPNSDSTDTMSLTLVETRTRMCVVAVLAETDSPALTCSGGVSDGQTQERN